MNNKYSVACITFVRDKYKINTDGICEVYTADSIQKFDSKSNQTADSIRDSIRTQKNDSQVPNNVLCIYHAEHFYYVGLYSVDGSTDRHDTALEFMWQPLCTVVLATC